MTFVCFIQKNDSFSTFEGLRLCRIQKYDKCKKKIHYELIESINNGVPLDSFSPQVVNIKSIDEYDFIQVHPERQFSVGKHLIKVTTGFVLFLTHTRIQKGERRCYK